jgi:hypothetical protein
VATALLFQQDPDVFVDGTVEQQSDAEAEWNSTTRDGKLTRLCESALNYLCAKSCNDIDLKTNARLLVDFERRLDEDPRLSEYIDDSDYSYDEPPPGTETEHEQNTTLPEHQVEKAKTIGGSVRDLPRRARATPTEVAQTGKTTEQVKAGSVQRGDAHTIRVNEDEIGKAKAEYRVKRPRRIDGLTAGKAKGLLAPSKNGAKAAYTASDLTYDIRTGLVDLIPPEEGGGGGRT